MKEKRKIFLGIFLIFGLFLTSCSNNSKNISKKENFQEKKPD
ncbi:hypothetical protein [Anaerococcus hydrogenalis]|nr:hypothetical protein [Anaerococcus hydrogenalis]